MRGSSIIAILAALLASSFTAVRAADMREINAAIDKGSNYLFSVQKDGLWEPPGDSYLAGNGPHHGGLTTIATYALLAAGTSPQDARLQKAIAYLKGLQTESAYVLGLRVQIWSYLGNSQETRHLIAHDTDLLIHSIKSEPPARGLYYYPKTAANLYDHSISQFGVLGLWAGERNGAEVPSDVWGMMEKAWVEHQSASGAWPYICGAKNSEEAQDALSMTSAGVASLIIIGDYSEANDTSVDNPHLDHGLKWIADNFSRLYKEHTRDFLSRFYTLYGIERIGVAGGYKYFGTINWFANGADYLVHHQNGKGSWGDEPDLFKYNINLVPDTCFGILFLSHGRAPVVVNKLSYSLGKGDAYPWNQHSRDIANLTRWTGRQLELPLNWHVVPLSAPVEDLHDAPILYISGSKPLQFSDEEVTKLRQLVQEGTLIVANANGASAGFTQSVKKLCNSMFPPYEMVELPADHPIYVNQQFPRSKFKNKPTIQCLSNGVRALVLLVPQQDASRAWQGRHDTDMLALGADIIQYATSGLDLHTQPQSYQVKMNSTPATESVTVARLEYSGNWDPEPGGWTRLAAILHNQFKIDLAVQAVKLGEGQLAQPVQPTPTRSPEELRKAAFKLIPQEQIMATEGDRAKIDALIDARIKEVQEHDAAAHPAPGPRFRFAHLTGTTGFELSEAQLQQLKRYVDAGGTLIVDAAGGSSSFAQSAEKLLVAMFGNADVQASLASPLPVGDGLYTRSGAAIDSIGYRKFARQELGNLKTPRLCAITKQGRRVAYYSREDLSGGLVGESIDGIKGYDPETATAIMRNLILSPTNP